MKTIFLVCAWVSIAMGVLLGTTAIYWMVWPFEGLTSSGPLDVRTHTVNAGELMVYDVTYCAPSVGVTLYLDREMVSMEPGHFLFPIPPPTSYLIAERCETRSMMVGIPMYVPAGTYQIHTKTGLRVNPLRTIQQVFVSEPFEVTR